MLKSGQHFKSGDLVLSPPPKDSDSEVVNVGPDCVLARIATDKQAGTPAPRKGGDASWRVPLQYGACSRTQRYAKKATRGNCKAQTEVLVP